MGLSNQGPTDAILGLACPRCNVYGASDTELGQYIMLYAQCPKCRADDLASKLGDSETIRRSLANDLNTQAETITSLELRLSSCELMLKQREQEAAAAGLGLQQAQYRIAAAFHRLGLTDQESEALEMVMRAVAEAREILIPSGRVVERQEPIDSQELREPAGRAP